MKVLVININEMLQPKVDGELPDLERICSVRVKRSKNIQQQKTPSLNEAVEKSNAVEASAFRRNIQENAELKSARISSEASCGGGCNEYI